MSDEQQSDEVPATSVSLASAACAEAIAGLEGWEPGCSLAAVEQLIARHMRQVILAYRTEIEYRPPLAHMLAAIPRLTGLSLAARGSYYDGMVTGRVDLGDKRFYAEWLQHPEESPRCRIYLLYDLTPELWAAFEAGPSEFWLRDDLTPVGWCDEDDSREPGIADRLVAAVTDVIRRTIQPLGSREG